MPLPFPLPTPTPSLVRRLEDQVAAHPLPTLLPRSVNIIEPRCEDCFTTTVTQTYYVDELGQSTSCTTTAFQTTTQTNTIAPLPTPTSTAQYETVYHTKTSTLFSTPTAAPSPPPFDSGSPKLPSTAPQIQGVSCQCEQDWVTTFIGGLPHGAKEIMASLAFFFNFLIFFIVALIRLKTYAGDKEMFFFLVPLTTFLAMMVSATATRAYAANNDSTSHFLAQHVMLAIAIPLLVDVSLQLYGLLSKRIIPSGWIDATALFLRLLNLVALVLYAVAAGALVSFVNAWTGGQADCTSSTIEKIGILNTVADVIEILIVIIGCACLFIARWKFRMQVGVLIIQYLLYVAFAFHFFWRVIHDLHATNSWRNRLDYLCAPLGHISASSYYPSHPQVSIDWQNLRNAANMGMNSAPVFWLLGILPIFIAATLLMAANLPRYICAVPQPVAEPDSVRYKLCYNEDAKKMEFQRLDNPGGPVLPNGEQLYELVRDNDGDGWAIREARIPTVLPAWQNVTFTPWYR